MDPGLRARLDQPSHMEDPPHMTWRHHRRTRTRRSYTGTVSFPWDHLNFKDYPWDFFWEQGHIGPGHVPTITPEWSPTTPHWVSQAGTQLHSSNPVYIHLTWVPSLGFDPPYLVKIGVPLAASHPGQSGPNDRLPYG